MTYKKKKIVLGCFKSTKLLQNTNKYHSLCNTGEFQITKIEKILPPILQHALSLLL